jgi:predicted alpha/beta-hydrolase family hydrolase
MPDEIIELKFLSTPEKGEVSALLMRPSDATHLLVLGHGASSNMRTPLLTKLAEHLANVGIATFRYNFPYSENRTGRNSNSTCIETIRSAVAAAKKAAPDLPLLAGGHSFSGRMTSHAQAENSLDGVKGIVFFSFPLHPAGRPGTERAEHLRNVKIPMLFLSGTRDDLGHLDLLEPVVKDLGPRATLHLLDTADHSYKTLKKTRTSTEDVFAEIGRVARDWLINNKEK